MQLVATTADPITVAAALQPRAEIASKLNLSVQDLFNRLHVNARTAVELGRRLTPAVAVQGIEPATVSGNFITLVQAARMVAPDAEQHLGAAEQAVMSLTQLLLGARNDATTQLDPTCFGSQFLRPFNEQLALVSRAATHVAGGAFG